MTVHTPHSHIPHSSTFNIGDVVRGRDVGNQPFEGAVESHPGPYSVMVDGAFTPTSLIDEVVSRAMPPAAAEGGVFD